jgi:hypothetical protein
MANRRASGRELEHHRRLGRGTTNESHKLQAWVVHNRYAKFRDREQQQGYNFDRYSTSRRANSDESDHR